jgi:hypothetical protein
MLRPDVGTLLYGEKTVLANRSSDDVRIGAQRSPSMPGSVELTTGHMTPGMGLLMVDKYPVEPLNVRFNIDDII